MKSGSDSYVLTISLMPNDNPAQTKTDFSTIKPPQMFFFYFQQNKSIASNICQTKMLFNFKLIQMQCKSDDFCCWKFFLKIEI